MGHNKFCKSCGQQLYEDHGDFLREKLCLSCYEGNQYLDNTDFGDEDDFDSYGSY